MVVRGCFKLRDEGQRPLRTMLSHPGAPSSCRHTYNKPVCEPGTDPPYQRIATAICLVQRAQARILFTAVALAIQAVRGCTKICQAAQQAQALERKVWEWSGTVTGLLHGLCLCWPFHFFVTLQTVHLMSNVVRTCQFHKA